MNLWQQTRNFIARHLASLAQLASISVRVDDSPGWEERSGSGVSDRNWTELHDDLSDALEAWRKNFLVRQIVRLTTAYVVGDGIRVYATIPAVEQFIRDFWEHEENRMDSRLSAWCDELTRAGGLFPILFTNKISGMSQVRATPAAQIKYIDADPNDYEKELAYHEQQLNELEPRIWRSKRTARIYTPREDRRHRRPDPMMLHYAINKPVGATRGEGDLPPILPWGKRYTAWLNDRVEFNRLRNELAGVDIEIDDDAKVNEKRDYYRAHPPVKRAITVHGKGEKISYPSANIQGYDAEPDGRALRLAVATGANVPLHFFAEGSSATRSTASEMGDPTHRHYRMRQKEICGFLVDLCSQAWRRYEQVNQLEPLKELGIKTEAPDVSRADNKALADSAKTIVEAFATMKQEGWITDELAVRLSFKFAGEVLEEADIKNILGGRQDASTEPSDDE